MSWQSFMNNSQLLLLTLTLLLLDLCLMGGWNTSCLF